MDRRPEAAPPCYYLRTKMFYVNQEMGIQYLQRSKTTESYWCVKTMRPEGPDEHPAEPEECRSSRKCFVPRALEV